MDLKLAGRVILVVGGTGLIGRATVERLRGEDAIVLSASRRGEADAVIDVTDDASVRACIDGVLTEHGRLDGVVVTAAPPARTLDPARRHDPDAVLEAVGIKGMGFLRVANAALPSMVEAGYGRIVGIAGQIGWQTASTAGAARNAALIIAAKNLADEVAGSGVTINTVNPGPVIPDEEWTDADAQVSLAQPGASTLSQVADLITFLVSPLGGGVNGEAIATGHRLRGVTAM